MDVGKNTTTSDSRADQRVELLVTTNSKLQVTRRDTLDTQVLGGVTGEFENLGGEVLEDGGGVDGSLGSDTHVVLGAGLEVTVDTTDGELCASCRGRERGRKRSAKQSRVGRVGMRRASEGEEGGATSPPNKLNV